MQSCLLTVVLARKNARPDNTVNDSFFLSFFFAVQNVSIASAGLLPSDIWHFLKITSDISWCFIIGRRHILLISGECEPGMSKLHTVSRSSTHLTLFISTVK